MDKSEAPGSPSTPRRLKKRVIVPVAILGAMLVLFCVVWVRGSFATSEERTPTSSAEGVWSQLWLSPDGRKVVRCSAVVDHPVGEVWKTVTDYENFEKVFPTLKSVKTATEPDGRRRLSCDVTSILGTWPVNVRIRHQELPGKNVASWDEPSGDVVVNRGSWALYPAGPGQTRVVYTLDVEVRPFPDPLVRAVLLSRQKTIVEALKNHLDKRSR